MFSYTEQKKVEVVTTYLILGSAVETARVTGVPVASIYRWKVEPWWKELVDQIQQEDNQALDAKLAKRIDKALELVQDRLENGDFVILKSGEVVRKPVSMKDTWKVNKEMIDVRLVLRKEKPADVNQEAVTEVLKKLALEFTSMVKSRVKETQNGPVEIQETKPDAVTSDEKVLSNG